MDKIGLFLLFLWFSPAQYSPMAVPRIATPPVANLETLEEKAHCLQAGKFINEWAEKFKLLDWDITLQCGLPDIPLTRSPGVFVHGLSQIFVVDRRAIVWVNPRSSYTPRQIVINELLHIVLEEIRVGDSQLLEERAVWNLAQIISKGDS